MASIPPVAPLLRAVYGMTTAALSDDQDLFEAAWAEAVEHEPLDVLATLLALTATLLEELARCRRRDPLELLRTAIARTDWEGTNGP